MSKAKTKTKPKPEETKTQDKPKPNNIQYQQGNGEFLAVQLLTLACNKLDVLINHTQAQVEVLQKIDKRMEDNQL